MDRERKSHWQEVREICIIAVVAIHILAEYQLRGILCAYDCGFCARKIVGYTFCEGSIWWIILSFEFLCCNDCILWCGCMCKYNIAQEN